MTADTPNIFANPSRLHCRAEEMRGAAWKGRKTGENRRKSPGEIVRYESLGGLLKHYQRKAA